VTFGGTAATSYTVNSATSITAVTPAHAAGAIDVAVTTANGTATLASGYTYVTPASTDATLSNLALSSGTLSPTFASGTTSYTASVTNGVSSITVTPTTTDSTATVTINGTAVISGSASSSIPLAIGSNSISVVVTAQDGSTTRTYTVTVTRAAAVPTVTSVSPTSGTTAGGSSVTITGTNLTGATAVTFGGTAATSYTVNSATSITAVTPAHAAGAIDVAVTTANGTATFASGYTYVTSSLTVTPSSSTLPSGTVGTAYSETISGSGGTSPYSYAVSSGSLPPGLTLNTSTGAISGTPTTAGSYNFAVTATDANRAVGSASYTLTIAAAPVTLTLSPSPGALTNGTVGAAFSATFTATKGTAPYTFAATGLPPGLSLNSSSGVLSGTPTTAGAYSITVTASDSSSPSNSGSGVYTLAVNAAPSFAFTPASGSALNNAMAGEKYSQQISAKGGAGSLIYSLASGSLPSGMTLNITTGELTGPLDSGTPGNYSFTIQVRDTNGATGTASYTLKVTEQEVTVADQVIEVPAGTTPNNVYLNKNATGGPFTEADIVSVEPSSAGTATIIQGELAAISTSSSPVGWYLKFTPNAAYSGQARVSFRLTGALGTSNTGTITYNLNYDADAVASDIDALVRSYVQARQSLISSSVKVQGLMERRQAKNATGPVTTSMSPSSEGITLGFSTSLAQLKAARDHADGVSDANSSPFNIWIDGTLFAHNREENGDKWGSFAMVNLGADYLLADRALIGLSVHYDRMVDPTDEDATLTGNGWLAGPYASLEVGKGVFWDTSFLYGGSANDIDTEFWDGTFDTERWMIDTSIKGVWNLDGATILTPKLRALYFNEKVEDYSVSNNAGDTIDINGFTSEQFRVSLGAEIARQFTLENGSILTPKVGLTAGFAGLDGSGAFGSVSTGASFQSVDGWSMEGNLLLNIEGDGEKSVGAKVGVSRIF